ncbi:MAG: NTPase [Thermodesulfobacteriota bacterium]
MKVKKILLTGPPRCGKTTLIEKLVHQINRPCRGFFTREIKEKGRRVGFSIITLDGQEARLAHESSKSSIRVGKYGVDLDQFEKIAIPAIWPSAAEYILIIDEIGKMECYSALFREVLLKILDAPNELIATIAWKGTPFIEKIKKRDDITLMRITLENRDALVSSLLGML